MAAPTAAAQQGTLITGCSFQEPQQLRESIPDGKLTEPLTAALSVSIAPSLARRDVVSNTVSESRGQKNSGLAQ
ncbi:hypothetical protein BTVI_140402 [Pitangus sulphuratus]|nr:hypothetical protein BTVI_140402 [Pitangus sulphuratus]